MKPGTHLGQHGFKASFQGGSPPESAPWVPLFEISAQTANHVHSFRRLPNGQMEFVEADSSTLPKKSDPAVFTLVAANFTEAATRTEPGVLQSKFVGKPGEERKQRSMGIHIPKAVGSIDNAAEIVRRQHLPNGPYCGESFSMNHVLQRCVKNHQVETTFREEFAHFRRVGKVEPDVEAVNFGPHPGDVQGRLIQIHGVDGSPLFGQRDGGTTGSAADFQNPAPLQWFFCFEPWDDVNAIVFDPCQEVVLQVVAALGSRQIPVFKANEEVLPQ